jgi:hypothetical protein
VANCVFVESAVVCVVFSVAVVGGVAKTDPRADEVPHFAGGTSLFGR